MRRSKSVGLFGREAEEPRRGSPTERGRTRQRSSAWLDTERPRAKSVGATAGRKHEGEGGRRQPRGLGEEVRDTSWSRDDTSRFTRMSVGDGAPRGDRGRRWEDSRVPRGPQDHKDRTSWTGREERTNVSRVLARRPHEVDLRAPTRGRGYGRTHGGQFMPPRGSRGAGRGRFSGSTRDWGPPGPQDLGRGGRGRRGRYEGPSGVKPVRPLAPQLPINYSLGCQPETFICSPGDLCFRPYQKELAYVHIKTERFVLKPVEKRAREPDLAAVQVLTPKGPAPLMHVLSSRLREQLENLMDFIVRERARHSEVQAKLVMRLGRQLYGAKRSPSSMMGPLDELGPLPVDHVVSMLSRGELVTTYEVNLPIMARDRILANYLTAVVGNGKRLHPEKTSTKYKLHIVQEGKANEVVVGCEVRQGRLVMKSVKTDQKRFGNMDISRPAANLDIRVQLNAKVLGAEREIPGLADFVGSLTLGDGEQALVKQSRTALRSNFILKRVRRIAKDVYDDHDDLWAIIHMKVQNMELREGDVDVRDMYLVEGQLLSWKISLGDDVHGDDVHDIPKKINRSFQQFFQRVWDATNCV